MKRLVGASSAGEVFVELQRAAQRLLHKVRCAVLARPGAEWECVAGQSDPREHADALDNAARSRRITTRQAREVTLYAPIPGPAKACLVLAQERRFSPQTRRLVHFLTDLAGAALDSVTARQAQILRLHDLERHTLAAELDSTIGQPAAALWLGLQRVPQAGELLAVSQGLTRGLMSFIGQLRSPLGGFDVLRATLEAEGVVYVGPVRGELHGLAGLCLWRIVQEAVSNARRHARAHPSGEAGARPARGSRRGP